MSKPYSIEWSSSPEERYDTDMNERAYALAQASGLKVVDQFGGTALVGPHETASDNGIALQAEALASVITLAQRVADEVGHDVRVLDPEQGFTTVHTATPTPKD